MSKSERANDLFILETLRYGVKKLADTFRFAGIIPEKAEIIQDMERCIKILEDRKK